MSKHDAKLSVAKKSHKEVEAKWKSAPCGRRTGAGRSSAPLRQRSVGVDNVEGHSLQSQRGVSVIRSFEFSLISRSHPNTSPEANQRWRLSLKDTEINRGVTSHVT